MFNDLMPRVTALFLRDKRLADCRSLAIASPQESLFRYTSGRWLYDEQRQLDRRHVRFNVEALCAVASGIFGTRCTQVTKLPEGLYNKVFSLKTDAGDELLARIPNPNAGSARKVVASEVATLDFVCWLPPFPLRYPSLLIRSTF